LFSDVFYDHFNVKKRFPRFFVIINHFYAFQIYLSDKMGLLVSSL
jgi:hypothetical protein